MARITTQELHKEIEQIKNNHLAHIHKDIDNLWVDVKDNRKYFQERLDRLDNRIWAIVLLSLGTLLSTVIGIMI
jgi:hypothetical protein